MQKILYIIAISALTLACASRSKNKSEGKNILMVTIEPQRYFLDQIVGDAYTVITLVPPGTSPETYEPPPSVMIEMKDSKAYFMVGDLGFENAWSKRLATNNPDVTVINCSRGIDLLEGHEHGHDHDHNHGHLHGDGDKHGKEVDNGHVSESVHIHRSDDGHNHGKNDSHNHVNGSGHDHGNAAGQHDHGDEKGTEQAENYALEHAHSGKDPHIWSSPESVKIFVRNIFDAMVALDPENEELFRTGYNALSQKIDDTDKQIREILNEAPTKSFIIYHPALGYFARDYGLHQYSIEFEGKSPSPSQIKELVDLSRKEKINTVFIQRGFDIKNATVVAQEIGAEVFEIDPLRYEWAEELLRIATILARKTNE